MATKVSEKYNKYLRETKSKLLKPIDVQLADNSLYLTRHMDSCKLSLFPSASLATYNSLLFVVGNIAVPDPWNRAMVSSLCLLLPLNGCLIISLSLSSSPS